VNDSDVGVNDSDGGVNDSVVLITTPALTGLVGSGTHCTGPLVLEQAGSRLGSAHAVDGAVHAFGLALFAGAILFDFFLIKRRRDEVDARSR
jgi:hypothetical protein